MPKRLVFIAHAPSDNTKALKEAAYAAIMETELEVQILAPQDVSQHSLDDADGLFLGMIENLASMSGLMKDVFDRCYYSWIDEHRGLPLAVYIRAGNSGIGTKRQLDQIVTGLGWRMVQPPLLLVGAYRKDFSNQTAELARGFAHGVEMGLF